MSIERKYNRIKKRIERYVKMIVNIRGWINKDEKKLKQIEKDNQFMIFY